MNNSFNIVGTGSYVPKKIVTNDDLSNLMDTNDEWITQRVGVKQRHVCVEETLGDIACEAANKALEMSNTSAKDLDLIICATISGEYSTPSLACIVQSMLGAECPAYDVNSACAGFMFALEAAAGHFARGTVNKVLVIGAERLSRILNWKDRSTAVIFGDGAGAAVLEKGNGFIASKISSKGNIDVLNIPNANTKNNPFVKEVSEVENYVHMDGQETFKFAVPTLCNDIKDVVSTAGITLNDISHVIPHQANIRIIDLAAKKLGIDRERFHTNIDRVGNTSSASVPILLDEINRKGLIKSGEYVAIAAFGGGLSSSACIMRW